MGSGRPERVGAALWQGGYLAMLSAVAGVLVALMAVPIFDLVGHEEPIRSNEIVYFRILCWGMGPLILSTALACFYSGRGRTWSVLGVNAAATGVNIVLDYGLIFGAWGLPEMGLRGAAWATNTAAVFAAGPLHPPAGAAVPPPALLHLRPPGASTAPSSRASSATAAPTASTSCSTSSPSPSSSSSSAAWAPWSLTASNLAFNINSLAFMPLIGAGIAVSTMVGQRLGAEAPAAAEYCTWSGLHVALAYAAIMTAAYILVPDLFLLPYGAGASGEEFVHARDLARSLLRIVGLYCLFDAAYIMFTAALKGAGDTRYIMYAGFLLGLSIMVAPPLIAVEWFDAGVYTVWVFIVAYLAVAAAVFYRRFRIGPWKSMRVIEESSPETSPAADAAS